MALDILEWGVIAVMGIAIFLFGPEKGAEIAKKLGAARRELDSATKQLQGMSKELGGGAGAGGLEGILGAIAGTTTVDQVIHNTANPGTPNPSSTAAPGGAAPAPGAVPAAGATATAPAPSPQARPDASSGDRLLVDMARKLGISTRGKTREDIQAEIVARASNAPAVVEKRAAPAPEASPGPQVEPAAQTAPAS